MTPSIVDILFGCWHSNYSFPLASKTNPAAMKTGHYVCCLDCGKEFAYDWKTMRVVGNSPQQIVEPESYKGDLMSSIERVVDKVLNPQ